MRRTFLFLTACLIAGAALAQSTPNLTYEKVPTAGQWNSYFAAKQDLLNYTPVNRAGGTMTGRLQTAPSTINGAGFAVLPGVAPTSPANGDIWMTSTGLFARVNNATVGPFANGSAFLSIGNALSEFAAAGSQATARTNIGAAASGSNADITSLSSLTTPLSMTQGGTGAGSLSGAFDTAFGSAQGSLLYRGATGWAVLGPGVSGQVLSTGGASANPSWQPGGGTGTVVSVALAAPSSLFTVSGSPVTSSGTLTLALATQAPNTVLAGPTSGSNAAPAFRALVPADIPAAADGCVRISVQSTTVLALNPYGCNTLSIGGVPRTVTATTCSISSPTAATLYYVYAAWSGSAVTCSFSTTGHIAGTDGREYLNASGSANTASRIIGMVYTNTIGAPLLDTASARWCLNWFRRRSLRARTDYSAVPVSNTSSVAAIGAAYNLISWGDEAVDVAVSGTATNSAQASTATTLWIDGTSQLAGNVIAAHYAAGVSTPVAARAGADVSEGLHTAVPAHSVSGGTSTITESLFVFVRG